MSIVRKIPAPVIPIVLLIVLGSQCGAQWEQINSGLTNTSVTALAISGTNLFAGTTGGGVFHSTNSGQTWTAVKSGLADTVIRALAISGTSLFAGTRSDFGDSGPGGVFLSTNNGATWTADGLKNWDINCFLVNGVDLFAGNSYGPAVFHTTNSGSTWAENFAGDDPSFVTSFAAIGSTLFASNEVMSGAGGGVYRSTDNGTTWTASSSGLTDLHDRCLVVSGNTLFLGTGIGVFLSTNNGGTWSPASTGLPASTVWSMAVSGGNLFAGTDGGVYLSKNNGLTWSAASTGLPANSGAGPFAVGGYYLYLATGSGVWRRPFSDILPIQLTSFVAQANGPHSLVLKWETISEVNNYGFTVQLSSEGREWDDCGVFVKGHGTTLDRQCYTVSLTIPGDSRWVRLVQADLDGTVTPLEGRMIQMESPAAYRLDQNYPNPCNPSTTIRYGLADKSYVTLTLYNTLGQKTATLVNEIQDAGNHEAVFDGGSLPSGVYFYRLRAGKFEETKRILLMR